MAFVKTNRIFLAATYALLVPHFALAQIVISEIMYDLPVGSDSGREWIEVYNPGPAAVDLTKLRLFENGTNHKIAATGVSVMQSSTYAVIADNATKFKTDWPGFSGQLFDSTFDLGNAGDSLELRDASSTVLDSATFTSTLGAGGDGNSLNRAPGTSEFSPRTPSPGAAMSAETIQPKEKPLPVPKVVVVKKSSTAKVTVSPVQNDVMASGTVANVQSTEVAAAANAATAPWEWWLAAGLLAFASAGAVVFARRFAKDEWDIVEE